MDPQRAKSFIRVAIIRRVSSFFGKMVVVAVVVGGACIGAANHAKTRPVKLQVTAEWRCKVCRG